MKKLLLVSLGIATLSGCTQMQRFSTDKMLTDYDGNNAARVRVTTNTDKVFAMANASCIDLNKAVSANTQYPHNPIRQKMSILEAIKKPQDAPYEDLTKSIGMPKVDLRDIFNRNEDYASREYRIEAGKPITFFIERKNRGIPILFTSGVNSYSFGFSFTPEKGHDYQITLTSHTTGYSDQFHSETNYYYYANLYDITYGKPVSIKFILNPAKECE